MSDPLSVAAAAVQLLDVLARLTKSAYAFIAALVAASAELRALQRDLARLGHLQKAVRETMCRVETRLAKQPQGRSRAKAGIDEDTDTLRHMRDDLEACKDDLGRIEHVLSKPYDGTRSVFNRFGKRVKFVFDEKEVQRLSSRIRSHLSTLSLWLSLIGR
ncbi:hypothetical protein BDY21DRAFT_361013 [Lineolata rhizophorae]|uniref:Fungal N-terminal domain-containing protein n=1 Tax=Lineolata rhizophorae TaxID=578093 RepID=A0A6A6PAM4_9PEZI|nr:hypothetical protein BDY21DRAFT_361013 [Lineolata rhizophorae]